MGRIVLVADDDPGTLDGLRALLTGWGYEVVPAADGRAALEKTIAVHPSAVITDVMMPVMNGLELLDALRVVRHAPPVIVLTAYGSLDNLLIATAEGAFAYLVKPVDVAKLKAVLASATREATWETTAS
jgi:two-component system response regulator GlrR